MKKLEFKGTKGEWVANGSIVYMDENSKTIYPYYECGGFGSEREANAKLIASAPLLLKEHQTDLEFLNKWVEKFNGVFGVGSDMSQELQDMIKSKEVAIFKALS